MGYLTIDLFLPTPYFLSNRPGPEAVISGQYAAGRTNPRFGPEGRTLHAANRHADSLRKPRDSRRPPAICQRWPHEAGEGKKEPPPKGRNAQHKISLSLFRFSELGLTLPPSQREMTAWSTPMASASCAWVIRLALRAAAMSNSASASGRFPRPA